MPDRDRTDEIPQVPGAGADPAAPVAPVVGSASLDAGRAADAAGAGAAVSAPALFDGDAVEPGATQAAPSRPRAVVLRRRRRLAAVAALGLAVGLAAGASALRHRPAPLVRRDVQAYAGLGAWVDTYDYVTTYAGPNPKVTTATIDGLADRGVRTIYLQAARNDTKTPGGIVDADLLASFLARAHARGIAVIGWSTPRFEDVAFDLDRLVKIATFAHKGQRFDGVAVDIEDKDTVPFPVTRTANLVELSKQLRAAVGPKATLGAIVIPPVQLDIVNPDYWPGFPWGDLRPLYDVWLPMTYWTTRDASSGWRDGERYTAESIRMLRQHLLDPDARVHAIGGIADKTTPDDVAAFLRALAETGAIGGSLYDVATTSDPVWIALQPLPQSLAPMPTTTAGPSTTTG